MRSASSDIFTADVPLRFLVCVEIFRKITIILRGADVGSQQRSFNISDDIHEIYSFE